MKGFPQVLSLMVLCCWISVTQAEAPDSHDPAHPVVVLTTSMGVIKIELFAEKAPVSVANFLQYVEKGFYDQTIFHRVIPFFMIQGGGMDQYFRKKAHRGSIVSEADNGLSNDRGTLAMARGQDADSAASQFFINIDDNHHLNISAESDGYTVFGKVIAGMDVVDEISMVETRNLGRFSDIPVEPVLLINARLQTGEYQTP